MRTTSRTLALLLLASAPALAQSPAARTPQVSKTKPKTERAAYDPVAEARRTTAVSLVAALADEARGFRDEQLRARVQARAADALWETEPDRSRALFRRAWDAAEQADREHARRMEEEKRRQMAANGSFALMRPPNIRGEVLKLAARRDRALGEELLAKLEEARKQETEATAAQPPAAPQPGATGPDSPSQRQRLELARQLLVAGDAERAMQFAGPALQTVSRDSIVFLSELRETSGEQADKIFAALVARSAADPAADANTVSLLSSYVFTPRMFITVDRDGGYSINSDGKSRAPAEFPAALRAAFLQTAAQILLRPPAPADQDQTTGGRSATYFMITRLLPFFEQFMPEPVAQLRTQLAALTPDVPDGFRSSTGQVSTAGLGRRDEPVEDEVQSALDRLARAKTPDERDRAYVSAAMAAADRGDARAREFAERVFDRDARAQLLAYVDYSMVARAIEKKDVEEVLRVARKGDLSPLQRVWAFTEAARLTLKQERAGALDLLDEAFAAARRIDGDNPDRARAMLSVITPLYELDPARVWSLMTELVKTVNALPDFTGEDGRITVKFQTKNNSSIVSSTVEGFNLQPLFRTLAKADLERAVELARSFTGESPRAVATLAVATAVLGETDKPRPKA